MVPRVGQRIGPYEILGRLGSGGMGLVYSAWDSRLQRDVAIKLLREEYSTPTMRSRFLQEARAASGLNHPNICTVFDIGEVAGDPFLVMELLKGETLRSRITQHGKLSPEDIQRVAIEVLDALAVAHTRGVIHRDIKPANIILVSKPGGSFQAKVLDFGLAKVEMGDQETTRFDLTTVGTAVGTVSYMSPEQARGEAIDARSDIFSLGSVLYEAATGELPFQGATSALIFVELLGKLPPPIRQQSPAIPRDLDRIIAKMLAKSRGDRFQSAAAAVEALQSMSLRRPPLGGLSLWNKKSVSEKARPEPSASATPEARAELPGVDLAPRPANQPAAPHVQQQTGSPVQRTAAEKAGSVVLRPVKPDPARTAQALSSSNEVPTTGLSTGATAETTSFPEKKAGSPDRHPDSSAETTNPLRTSVSPKAGSAATLREGAPIPPSTPRTAARGGAGATHSPSVTRKPTASTADTIRRALLPWILAVLLALLAGAALLFYLDARREPVAGKPPVVHPAPQHGKQ